jgi:hypothetical protein
MSNLVKSFLRPATLARLGLAAILLIVASLEARVESVPSGTWGPGGVMTSPRTGASASCFPTGSFSSPAATAATGP